MKSGFLPALTIGWCLARLASSPLQAQLPAELTDPRVNSLNRLPARALYQPYESAELARQGQPSTSARFLNLNGIWKIFWTPRPANRPPDFFLPSADDSRWPEIPVPGNWELNGFGTPFFRDEAYEFTRDDPPHPPDIPADYNPVGCYRRWFELPESWSGQRVILHLGAVKSAVYVYLNGQRTGYSEDSKVEAEFDITGTLKPGRNLLALEVYRFCDGSYLEAQDFWRISGIERDVYLYCRPPVHLGDFTVRADLEGDYRDGRLELAVELENHTTATLAAGQRTLEWELAGPDGRRVLGGRASLEAPVGTGGQGRWLLWGTVPRVQAWSAEIPNLYRLQLTLLDARSNVQEVICRPVGFRRIEIRNARLLINGQPVIIRGVNRHEHHPRTAHVVDEASMREDIRLLKQGNFNAVRNCHYPNHPRWYELCDQYGLYLVDEANLESHGMPDSPDLTLANNPQWLTAHLERIQRAVIRSKNHPSVIIWSLGNEAGHGRNFIQGYHWVKGADPTRPVQYEPAGAGEFTDIYCPMYPKFDKIRHYLNGNQPKPFIMCEYSHAMGNSTGNFREYWELMEANPVMQGGFIWDWVDQALRVEKDGRTFFGYSGGQDFGEKPGDYVEVCSSGDGLVAPDRQPHPQYFTVQQEYTPLKFRLPDPARGELEIRNTWLFRDTSNLCLDWEILADGQPVKAGRLDELDVPPGQSRRIVLNDGFKPDTGRECFLNVRASYRQAEPLIPAGLVMAWQQFPLGGSRPAPPAPSATGRLHVQPDGRRLTITAPDLRAVFDLTSGSLQLYEYRGKPYLSSGPRADFWRPPTDNDFGAGLPEKLRIWKDAVQAGGPPEVTWHQPSAGLAEVISRQDLLSGDARLETTCRLHADGRLQIGIQLLALAGQHPMLPKFGSMLRLPAEFNRLRWYGRGPRESYWDRQIDNPVGIYEGPVASQLHAYVRPQESGNHTGVRWAEVTGDDGRGWRIEGEELLNVATLPFAPEDFDQGPVKRVTHHADLKPRPEVYLHVDYLQMGVGGLNSWGALPLETYRIPYRSYGYRYWLTPLPAR